MCLYVHVNLLLIIMCLMHRVTESKNKDYTVGDLIVASFGWRTHTISDGTGGVRKIDPSIPLSPSTGVGILGMPG